MDILFFHEHNYNNINNEIKKIIDDCKLINNIDYLYNSNKKEYYSTTTAFIDIIILNSNHTNPYINYCLVIKVCKYYYYIYQINYKKCNKNHLFLDIYGVVSINIKK